MPSTSGYPFDSESGQRVIIEAARTEKRERSAMIESKWDYYRGHHRKPLKVEGRTDDNVIMNLCRPVVDRMVSFLVPDFPRLELNEDEDTDEEVWLMDAWEANGGAQLLSNLVKTAGIGGHGFARVMRPMFEGDYPRVLWLDDKTVIPFWDGSDKSMVHFYMLLWSAGKVDYRQDVIRDGEQWIIRDYSKEGSGWQLDEEIVWPYPLGPIVDWQHLPEPREFYGGGELQNAGLNDAVNKVASDVQRILRFHAFPKTIVIGADMGDLHQTGVDGVLSTVNPDVKVQNIEMQSDLQSSMGMLQTTMHQFLAENRTILTSGDPAAFRGMTNLAIRATFMPQVDKNNTLQRMYARGVINPISQRLLMLGGFEWMQRVVVHWPDALPVDEREDVGLVQQKIAMGLMSKQTAAATLGLDWDVEQERRAREAEMETINVQGMPAGVSG